jgi:endonuclease/exonuclease/phosphatase family metal-dependent hydrolase
MDAFGATRNGGKMKNELKIATWNMAWNLNTDNGDRIWQFILNECEFKPDIIFFQEAYLNKLINIPGQFLFKPSETSSIQKQWGTGIFVRQGIGHIESIEYPCINAMTKIKTRPDKTVIGKITLTNEYNTYLVSAHIDSSKSSRKEFTPQNEDVIIDHIDEVFSIVTPIIKNSNFLFCGDFNADRSMGKEYKNMFTKICDSSYEEKYIEWQFENDKHETQTFFGESMSIWNHYQDDHIFVNIENAKKISECFVGNYGQFKRYSDHAPIFMTLSMGNI